jgi:outer membrane murein-binding lipoprotein Lpp
MPNLVFKRLTIASDTLKSANQYNFKPRFNLITGNDNSLGKSTLAKLLLWTLGSDPDLDFTWQSFDVRALVDFSIGNAAYQVGRYGNTMFLRRPDGDWEGFQKITGEYSEAFAKIAGFGALLPNRKETTTLESPPPAYYFLPFYVDQQRSWSQAWNSFSNLEQYARWQKTIIQYHTGYLAPEFFSIEEKIAQSTLERKNAESEVKKIETAIEVVKAYIPTNEKTFALTRSEFDALSAEVSIEISKLQAKQEELLRTIAEIQTERAYLQGQLDLAKLASSELEKDYTFSVECVAGETLICPLCGTIHDNSSPNRASILADKDEADSQVETLSAKIARLDNKYIQSQERLTAARFEIDVINNKYKQDEAFTERQAEPKSEKPSFLDSLASRSVQKHVQRTMETKTALIRDINHINRALRKDQKKLLPKEEREDMDAAFKDNLAKYVNDLKAQGVNLSPIESSLDYKKLYGSGGAAESTRGILAYYMAVLRQIHAAKNEVFSAVIIDTPNQQEQADFNYEKILQFLMNTIPSDAQLILCAMNRKEIGAYKQSAYVIALDDDKILSRTKYNEFRTMLNFDDSI